MISPTRAVKHLRLAARLVGGAPVDDHVPGPALALMRQSLGVDAVSLAARLGVTKQMVSKTERTGRPPGSAAVYVEACLDLARSK